LGTIRIGARLLLAAAVVSLLCGCAEIAPSVPAANDWTVPAKPGNAAGRAVPRRPAAVGPPIRTVPAARRALAATLGIQVFWNSAGTPAELAADANRIFNYVVGLGANSVGINFFFYTDGVYPTRVYGVRGSTPSPATIAAVIASARQHGLRVLLRPLLNENNIVDSRGDWRGSIQPPSVSGWFHSYWDFLEPYFAAAQRSGATSVNVGSELDSLAPDQYEWTAFEAAAAKVFTGQLEYAVNYGRWELDPAYEPVPDASVDAWPQLGLGDGATVPELTAAWVSWLHNQPESVLRRTVLQEVGIAAVSGAYAEPAKTAPPGATLDVAIQDKWFAAACAAVQQTDMAGIYFYAVNSTDHPGDAAGYGPGSFIGRGDRVIKTCFAHGWH
jgi:Glycoside Hydrolase Family 113